MARRLLDTLLRERSSPQLVHLIYNISCPPPHSYGSRLRSRSTRTSNSICLVCATANSATLSCRNTRSQNATTVVILLYHNHHSAYFRSPPPLPHINAAPTCGEHPFITVDKTSTPASAPLMFPATDKIVSHPSVLHRALAPLAAAR